ncbi:hypothetical protein XELAEV_18002030mg [Xenopus laevis]|uniref:Uncharacterized protein n=1 Tax=Xenopus laevis TaxID=8355 RepID=A0A974GZ25_XENLA|nr:hypothetical protein XELAEV_18002030mg [Xenopus laevis]
MMNTRPHTHSGQDIGHIIQYSMTSTRETTTSILVGLLTSTTKGRQGQAATEWTRLSLQPIWHTPTFGRYMIYTPPGIDTFVRDTFVPPPEQTLLHSMTSIYSTLRRVPRFGTLGSTRLFGTRLSLPPRNVRTCVYPVVTCYPEY